MSYPLYKGNATYLKNITKEEGHAVIPKTLTFFRCPGWVTNIWMATVVEGTEQTMWLLLNYQTHTVFHYTGRSFILGWYWLFQSCMRNIELYMQRHCLGCESKEADFPMWRINRFLLALYDATCCNNFKIVYQRTLTGIYDPFSRDLNNSAQWYWGMQQTDFSLINTKMWVVTNVSSMLQCTRC